MAAWGLAGPNATARQCLGASPLAGSTKIDKPVSSPIGCGPHQEFVDLGGPVRTPDFASRSEFRDDALKRFAQIQNQLGTISSGVASTEVTNDKV